MQEKGHVPLKLGGGSTPFVAVLDTHCHAAYQKSYQAAEMHDAQVQLRRGHTLPCTSRQTVLTRAVTCWQDLNHQRMSEVGWKANGLTLALDGSEDGAVSKTCRPFWEELEMARVREQLLVEVADAVASGQITSWWQYPDLLEPYDQHDGVQEGLECVPEELEEEGQDEDGKGADNAAEEEEDDQAQLAEDQKVIEEDARETATSQVPAENSKDHLAALLAMREQARNLQDVPTMRFLDNRLADLARLQERPSETVSVHLRQKAIERRQAEATWRAQKEADRERARNLQQEERLAKLALETAKANKSAAQASAQQKLEEARAAREANQDAAKQAARQERACRLHFAARLANHLLTWTTWKPCPAEMDELNEAIRKACSMKLGEKALNAPDFWDACRADLIWGQRACRETG